MVISDDGKAVIPLRRRGGDRPRALPHWGGVIGVVVAMEAQPWMIAMGHARVFDVGVGGWTNEQTVFLESFWCGET